MGGDDAVRVWTERAQAEFPTIVDAGNVFGALLGFKVIPNGVLLDPEGVIRYAKLGGFEVSHAADVAAVEAAMQAPSTAPPTTTTAPDLTRAQQDRVAMLLREGTQQIATGHRNAGLASWRAALEIDPANFVIRKQLWRADHPERFGEVIDFDWQGAACAGGAAIGASSTPSGSASRGPMGPSGRARQRAAAAASTAERRCRVAEARRSIATSFHGIASCAAGASMAPIGDLALAPPRQPHHLAHLLRRQVGMQRVPRGVEDAHAEEPPVILDRQVEVGGVPAEDREQRRPVDDSLTAWPRLAHEAVVDEVDDGVLRVRLVDVGGDAPRGREGIFHPAEDVRRIEANAEHVGSDRLDQPGQLERRRVGVGLDVDAAAEVAQKRRDRPQKRLGRFELRGPRHGDIEAGGFTAERRADLSYSRWSDRRESAARGRAGSRRHLMPASGPRGPTRRASD